MESRVDLRTHPEQPSLQDPSNSARNLVTEKSKEAAAETQIRRMNVRQAAFVILACSVSPTSLGLVGYCAASTGAIGFIIVTFLSYFVNFFTLQLLVRTQEIMKAKSYDDIGNLLFGRKAKVSILVVSTICLMGVSIASIVYLKNVIVGIIFSFTDDPPPLLGSTSFWAVIFCEGVMLPLTCMPRLKGASYVSSFTSILPLFLLFAVIPHYFMNGDQFTSESGIILFSQYPSHYFESFSLLIYPLVVHPNILTIFSELINPTHKRKLQSILIGIFSEIIIFSIIAYFNYFHFSNRVALLVEEQNIFQMSSYIEWVPMRILAVVFLTSPITMAITMNITLKVQAIRLWCKNSTRPCFWNMAVSFILCQIIMIPTVFLNQVSLAVRLVSAVFYPVVSEICSFQVCYVLPGIFYFKVQKSKSRSKMSVKILGIVMSGIFIVFSFYGAVDVGNKIFR